MCALCFGGPNVLLALCSKYYFIQIYEILSISSLVLGIVIAQIWLFCSDWLCLFWSHCRDLHTRFFAKGFLSRSILVLEVINEQSAYSACSLNFFWLILENKMAVIAVFPIFILNFSLHSYYGCVIATVQEKLGTKRGCLKLWFLECECVCVCTGQVG